MNWTTSVTGDGRPIYLTSPSYPNNVTLTTPYEIECRVTTESSFLTVYTLDVRLVNENDTCTGSLQFEDNSGKVEELGCYDDVDEHFNVTSMEFSKRLTIRLNVTSATTLGLIWIGLEGESVDVSML